MNFTHLQYFLMVAEELNITRAAERLYISQQSLSTHISNLEKEVNVKLFTRSPKLALTYAGSLFVDTSHNILNLHSQFMNQVGDIDHHYTGNLRLGISHTCGLALLPEIFPAFKKEFPLVDFSLFEGNSTQLEEELVHNRCDFVICFHPVLVEDAHIIPLCKVRLILAVPKSFTDSIFGDKAADIRENAQFGIDIGLFRSLPFVFLKRGNRARGLVNEYLRSCAFAPTLAIETENTVTALALAKAQTGIFLCPDLFLQEQFSVSSPEMLQALDLFPLKEAYAESQLVLAYRNGHYLPQFSIRFIQIVKDIFCNNAGETSG